MRNDQINKKNQNMFYICMRFLKNEKEHFKKTR